MRCVFHGCFLAHNKHFKSMLQSNDEGEPPFIILEVSVLFGPEAAWFNMAQGAQAGL